MSSVCYLKCAPDHRSATQLGSTERKLAWTVINHSGWMKNAQDRFRAAKGTGEILSSKTNRGWADILDEVFAGSNEVGAEGAIVPCI